MVIGETSAKTPTTRERIDAILADEAAAEDLAKQVAWFVLRRKPSGRNQRLSEITALLVDRRVVLREGFIDAIDDKRVRVLSIDILRALAASPNATDKDLEDLDRISIGGPYTTNLLLDRADGEEIFDLDSKGPES